MTRRKTSGDIDHHAFGWYVRNCARSPFANRIQSVLLEQVNRLKGRSHDEEDGNPLSLAAGDFDSSAKARVQRRRLREFRRLLQNFRNPPPTDPIYEQNVFFARDEFGLDAIDTEILLLQLRYERSNTIENFIDEVAGVICPNRALEALLRLDCHDVKHRMSEKGALIGTGLLTIGECSHFDPRGPVGIGVTFSPALRKVMHRAFTSRQEWVSAIVGSSLSPTCSWEDFEHLGSGRDLAARVIEGARNGQHKGINVLLHGPVGTGKTEFCKVLATRSGGSIWSVGESDSDGGEPTRSERLASLRLAQHLLAKRPDALILFDEAEDFIAGEITLIGTRRSLAGSKVHTNRMLEQNPVPVLWTCNETNAIDPAVLRRMTLALEVKTPNQPARAQIWRRVSAEANLCLDESLISRLAKTYAAPPGVAINAARAAMLARGGITEIEEVMAGILRLLDIAPLLADGDVSDFDPALTNCRDDLPGLVEWLAHPRSRRNWSLCLHGAPGTGKSKFARYLATKLDMEVVQHRVSDLYSKWVGKSEKQIAAAFAAARAQRHLLIFDEADSLLQDRRNAARSWEVTHVNEMLTWMESHPLPFVCTTNLMDNLDPASLRRFTFKTRFDTLTSAQAALAFERFFGQAAPRSLPEGLAPGDFAVIRRKAELLGITDPNALIDWLKDEVTAKGIRASEIGFVIGPR